MQNPSKTAEPLWTIHKILNWTTSYFKSHNIDTPRLDAEILLACALKSGRTALYMQHDMPLSADERAAFKALIKRRVLREPVAYIVGSKGFWSLEMTVTKDVLIPRPETECLIETALSDLSRSGPAPKSVLELGTGSGAIILALASEHPEHLFFASDRSADALKVARKNAIRNNIGISDRFFSGDWFSPIRENMPLFDMIISNPPYIRTGDIAQLQPEISKYEPMTALDGGKDGLDAYRAIIPSAHTYLAEGGTLILEIGSDQKDDIRQIIDACGCYESVLFKKDYAKCDRVAQMRKKSPD